MIQPSIHLRLVQGIKQKGCICIHHYGHYAQSLGRIGSSSRQLPCDSRSTYRVSVRCVRNFDSFSIGWCRCEVLSKPHLFSVSFWKCKVLSCSPCIFCCVSLQLPWRRTVYFQQFTLRYQLSSICNWVHVKTNEIQGWCSGILDI
jgi:hypothetical protein